MELSEINDKVTNFLNELSKEIGEKILLITLINRNEVAEIVSVFMKDKNIDVLPTNLSITVQLKKISKQTG